MDNYRILQITSVSIFDKKPLKELFSEGKVQNLEGDVSKRLNLWGE